MNICVVGASGAFGTKHLEALSQIDDVQVTALVGSEVDKMTALGKQYPHAVISDSLSEALKLDNVDAVILATPTHLHASQAIECLEAGKHVLVEIPMADNIEDARRLVETQQRTGLVAVAGHTRRFNPSHQWIHNKIAAGELHIQQMDVQTYFFRRTNTNAKGEARTWTDHLLWHHACHTVDLFQYQTGESASQLQAMQGPIHPQLGIAMDMSIGMKVPSGALCTLSLSFNNDGPFGTFFRYICEEGTYLARYDDLYDGYENPIDLSGVAVSNNGIELIDREFIAAIREKREPNSSVLQCLSAMETLHKLEQLLENNG
ncbi:Gfo/Idh/MocA family oxidoreductase [Vibrio fluvialis]|jgi:2-hydroxy-4-carboxymuconate semialdehyde hemiacetal dehydrogenase|uniref:4-carboxy-2-hydroxymuconate-6-semialdehyde dehydrogenase n=1 Tax=Vibrio fluvialis PG41 TaxID=1336752 RepID=S7HZ27_VIBFL|nr:MULTISPECIES: Gfo/Idh/MocA family oxidoreductase [Vibrio]HDM8033560.1 Gfo/Idh/MocA family oxidoreductase [Vibrio fluvialis clinical-1]AVH32520.1 gfo/Idh/MocA family oxidoreductase [Vibrio fluvialis]EKO3366637.1 Gfo/Idh/MocA family oxidoreductase [Vibrio fluvialis]EKO3372004.1 Gfo/Idh/MocA family oxidoreductase [Vibrio fluvialis]EKO3383351.1 Gfo/Idh/MocA family oxidoreductase [Vibrio fluvialis]